MTQLIGKRDDLAKPMALKSHYRSGSDDLAKDFFQPCLMRASRYRRAVGYFSRSALLSWTEALLRLAREGDLTVQLIASPELSPADAATLRSLQDPGQTAAYQSVIVDQVFKEILALLDAPDDRALRASVFAWLVANDRLQLKFAFPEHVDDAGIFHEKIHASATTRVSLYFYNEMSDVDKFIRGIQRHEYKVNKLIDKSLPDIL